MKHLVESNTYHGHLLQIETFAQAEPDLDFSLVDVERLLLRSIEQVRTEIRRRYREATRAPMHVDSGTDDDPQVGWVYSYKADVVMGNEKKTVPHRDWVRVYKLDGEVIDPDEVEDD